MLSEIEFPVKMRGTRGQTERPRAPLLQLCTGIRDGMRRIGGRLRSPGSGSDGAVLEIPPFLFLMSNRGSKQGPGPCMVGSLTGAVASQRVTEARDGKLRPVGNRLLSAMAQACLTARPTSQAETKVGHSDPVVPRGRAIAQRIKGTPGITG